MTNTSEINVEYGIRQSGIKAYTKLLRDSQRHIWFRMTDCEVRDRTLCRLGKTALAATYSTLQKHNQLTSILHRITTLVREAVAVPTS